VSLRLRDLLARNTELYGRRPAVVFAGRETTWAAFQERVFRLANRLRADGVAHGDRVAILQGNGPEIGELAFATALLGAVMVPVSSRSAPAEAAYVFEDAEVVRVFAGEPHAALADGAGVPVVLTRSPEYEAYVAGGDAEEPPAAERADDVAVQLYTSGTTGRPKGALHTQRTMIVNGITTAHSQGIAHGDVFLAATPLTHAAAATRVYSLAFDGMTMVIQERFEPDAFLDAIARHGVTTTIVVPAMLRALLAEPALDTADLGTLRLLVYGAAPTPRPLIEEAMRRLPCGFLHAYGLTEGCPALTALGVAEHRLAASDPAAAGLLDSIGTPVTGVRISVGEPGSARRPGDAGELWVRSDKNMAGYWKRPEATAEVLRDGWLATGDVARADEHGRLYLVDRAKDVVISGGLNVYPSEIERVLTASGRVAEVSVIGVEDDRWGEVPVAFVVPRADALDAAELRRVCELELARYKVPAEFVPLDRLPRNETGKILKRELRDRWMSREAVVDGG
jgi:acyl-CoA synthetase (AMP-forming)/AMP-acid ligase II